MNQDDEMTFEVETITDFKIPDEGMQDMIIQGLVDLGSQPQRPFKNKKTGEEEPKPPCLMLRIVFEVPVGDNMTAKISKDYTRKVSDDSNLGKLLKAAFRTNTVLDAANMFKSPGGSQALIGTKVRGDVIHRVKGDKTYANLGDVVALDPRVVDSVPDLQGEPFIFMFKRSDAVEVFKKHLEPWVRDQIVKSLNSDQLPPEVHEAYKDMQEDKAAASVLS